MNKQLRKCVKRMLKSKATDWEKILAIHISDKGLVSKIYEVPFTLHSKKKSTFKQSAKHLTKKRYMDGKQSHEKIKEVSHLENAD